MVNLDNVQRRVIASEKQWLEMRNKNVNASEVEALFGVHQYTTPFRMYHLKKGVIAPDDVASSPLVKAGSAFEAPIAEILYAKEYGVNVYFDDGYYSLPIVGEYGLGCTPDYLDGDGCPIDVKYVSHWALADSWKDKDGELSPPPWVQLQLQTQMMLLGKRKGKVVAYIEGGKGVQVFDFQEDKKIQEEIYCRTQAFWQDFFNEKVPEVYGDDVDCVRYLYANAEPDSAIDLTDNSHADSILEHYKECLLLSQKTKKELHFATAQVLSLLGNHELGSTDRYTVYSYTVPEKRIDRKSYIRKAYRGRITIKEKESTDDSC